MLGATGIEQGDGAAGTKAPGELSLARVRAERSDGRFSSGAPREKRDVGHAFFNEVAPEGLMKK